MKKRLWENTILKEWDGIIVSFRVEKRLWENTILKEWCGIIISFSVEKRLWENTILTEWCGIIISFRVEKRLWENTILKERCGIIISFRVKILRLCRDMPRACPHRRMANLYSFPSYPISTGNIFRALYYQIPLTSAPASVFSVDSV
ncbi:MAG: hypothetical protein I3J02_07040 [Prevotella sp.]|nr:hypothetical protein [Prevotella sp.]